MQPASTTRSSSESCAGSMSVSIPARRAAERASARDRFWKEAARDPPPPVLVHCSAGQNRSAAVALAIMLHYGVNFDKAVETIKGSATKSESPGEAWDREGWEKFVGESGEMLLQIVKENFVK